MVFSAAVDPLDFLPELEGVAPLRAPELEDLAADARGRIVQFIVTATLGGGVAPVAIAALYADLAGDEPAIRYVDQRFTLKRIPSDWREVEDRVLDLDEAARRRGVDLAAAWRRATSVAVPSDDPLEQLARLAGIPSNLRSSNRSIFDDPEDLDEDEDEPELARRVAMVDRLPDMVDLEVGAVASIRKYGIEEQLEYGLAPYELIELYRGLAVNDDERARQYLDRIFVEKQPPLDWLELQEEAQKVRGFAESRGRDAGRLYAEVRGVSPGIDPLVALQLVVERLQLS